MSLKLKQLNKCQKLLQRKVHKRRWPKLSLIFSQPSKLQKLLQRKEAKLKYLLSNQPNSYNNWVLHRRITSNHLLSILHNNSNILLKCHYKWWLYQQFKFLSHNQLSFMNKHKIKSQLLSQLRSQLLKQQRNQLKVKYKRNQRITWRCSYSKGKIYKYLSHRCKCSKWWCTLRCSSLWCKTSF